MAGSSPVMIRRWLAPVASLLRPRPLSASPTPPGPLPMTRSGILTRYRHLRQISRELHESVLNIIAPDVLLNWARRLDLTEGKAVVPETEDELTLPEDLAIYLPRLGHPHPLDRYAKVARFGPGSGEAIVFAAMRRARFSLWRIERRHHITGLILRDLLRDEEIWLVDETMERSAPLGLEMAARLLQPDSFAMTARIIVPLLPHLMEEAFARAPALRHIQGHVLADDPRFTIAVYRAAVTLGAIHSVRFNRK